METRLFGIIKGKYFIPNKNEDKLAAIKIDPSQSLIKVKTGGQVIKIVTSSPKPQVEFTSIPVNSVTYERHQDFH